MKKFVYKVETSLTNRLCNNLLGNKHVYEHGKP